MENKKRVAFYTLGCKVNSAETDVLAASFVERGYDVVDFNEISDVYLINTCTVTHQADSQCRNIINRARKSSPEAVIAVTGCYAQADPSGVSKIPGVDLVLGTREKYSIFDHLENNSCFTQPLIKTNLDIDPFEKEGALPFGSSRTRAFLKVQDGCSYKCTYCIIPSVRGESINRKRDDVFKRIIEIRNAGFKEIVLTAVNLGEYDDGQGYGLLELLQDINLIHDLPRIRLTSIEPNCLSEDIIKFIGSSDKFCSHFHIPLQSGCDSVLKRMKRKYMTKRYSKAIADVMKYVPDASIGADVMVGFPGETEEEFRASADFIKSLPISYLHVFRYSPRDGTEAAAGGNFVHPSDAKARSKELIAISDAKKKEFFEKQVGKISNVLFENKQKEDFTFEGFTENYARVKCVGEDLSNTIKGVTIKEYDNGILVGTLRDQPSVGSVKKNDVIDSTK